MNSLGEEARNTCPIEKENPTGRGRELEKKPMSGKNGLDVKLNIRSIMEKHSSLSFTCFHVISVPQPRFRLSFAYR